MRIHRSAVSKLRMYRKAPKERHGLTRGITMFVENNTLWILSRVNYLQQQTGKLRLKLVILRLEYTPLRNSFFVIRAQNSRRRAIDRVEDFELKKYMYTYSVNLILLPACQYFFGPRGSVVSKNGIWYCLFFSRNILIIVPCFQSSAVTIAA